MSAAGKTQPPPPEHGRRIGVWVVLVVAGLLLVLSSFAVWVNRVALDTGVFVDTSTELIEDDTIRSAVAARAVDELFANVDVQAEIEQQLPDDVKSLSGPTAAGLRQAAYELVERALEQPALQRLWRSSLEHSHETLVAVLEDESGAVTTTGGVVTLDLEQIVLEAADRVGIRSQVEDKLPADVGQIVVLRSDELDTAQNAFQVLETLAWFLPLLALAAWIAAVGIARDRRAAVRNAGVVLLATGLVGLVAVGVVGRYIVDSLTSETDVRAAADNAWDILTELLRASFRTYVVAGVLFVVAAWLAGPGYRAIAARRALAPALRERVWGYAALALIVVVLLLTSPVSDFVGLLFLLLVVILGAAWIELMRRQTVHEFPEAERLASLSDGWSRLAGWWESQQSARERRRPAAPSVGADVASQLARLAELHAQGELTDAEYTAAKARVLDGE